MTRHAPRLECSIEDKASLVALAKSRTTEARAVERARIILACLEGKEIQQVSVGGGEERGHYGGDGGENGATFQLEPFPLDPRFDSERPGAVKGAPLLGAAKRTLDGEDRSGAIRKRERLLLRARNWPHKSGPFARRPNKWLGN